MFSVALRNRHYTFQTLNELLGKARAARASHHRPRRPRREGARCAWRVLADVTLETLFENPAVPYERCEVTRTIIDGVDGAVYARLRGWTVGGLREFLLASRPNEIHAILRGLTAEMIAAAVKLCSNWTWWRSRRRCATPRARAPHSAAGVLSSALGRSPGDSVPGISPTYEGLAYGSGDA